MIRCSLSHNRFNVNFTEEDLASPEELQSSCVEIFELPDAGTVVRISSCENGPVGGAVKVKGVVVGWTYTFSVNTVRGIRTLLSKKKMQLSDEFGLTEVTTLNKSSNAIEVLLPASEQRKKPLHPKRPSGIPGHGPGIRTKHPGKRVEDVADSSISGSKSEFPTAFLASFGEPGVVYTKDSSIFTNSDIIDGITWKETSSLLGIPILSTPISLREAVEAVNIHKARAGKDLALSITDSGRLYALIEYGG